MRFAFAILALAGLGCGSTAFVVDASATTDASAAARPDVASADATVPSRCSLGGTGRLRVAVTLDPSLQRRGPEVWLAARCGDDDRLVRLVRWDRSDTMVLDGFAPGSYSVLASSFLAPAARTARVEVDPSSTASLGVTLPAEPTALVSLRAGAGVVGAVDAGAPLRDAAASVDASLRPAWSGRGVIEDPAFPMPVGSVEVDAVLVAAGTLELRVLVRSGCVASSASACPSLSLSGVEARTLLSDAPHDLALGAFERTRVGAGESVVLSRPLVVRGELPGPTSALQIAVFGVVARAAAAPMRP